MEEIEKLKSENESLKNSLINAMAEKTAIDQLCMMHIKDNVVLRTQIELFKVELGKKDKQINYILNQKPSEAVDGA